MSWITLFITFSFSFMLYNILNYFCFFNFPNMKSSPLSSSNFLVSKMHFWKW